jgi:alkaline phosphatase
MRAPRTFIRLFSCVMIVVLVLGGMQTTVTLASPNPKNIIVMIGDGMGYNQSLAASYYHYGAGGMQIYNDFPYQIAVSTYSADGWGYDPSQAWSDFQYVKTRYTDSAAAATAMATGVKTYDAGIGVDVNGNPVGNIFESAEAAGKSTGVVTTVVISHATPAGFVAHNLSRDNYVAIANEMIFDSDTDVIMGTGNPWFDNNGQPRATPNTYNYVGGQATWDALVAGTVSSDRDNDGVDEVAILIQEESQFEALMTGPTPEFVIGVAQVYTTLQQSRSGDAMADPYVVPLNGNFPTLTEMSLAAINILDNNPNGFALMIEGGAIDWAAHANQPGRMIEEQIDFDQAVEAVVSWVETNSNWADSLLIVTGDHETGYLWGPDSNPTWEPLINNGLGVLPGMQFNSPNHTNSLVPIYAMGDDVYLFNNLLVGWDPVRGDYLDNTSVARVIFKVLSLFKLFLPVIERQSF